MSIKSQFILADASSSKEMRKTIAMSQQSQSLNYYYRYTILWFSFLLALQSSTNCLSIIHKTKFLMLTT